MHRWFTYPSGYSYRLVESKIREYGLNGRHWIADPFLGSGTTSVVAKAAGVNSVGIEAHPFVFWVAQTKLHFEHNAGQLDSDARRVLQTARTLYADGLEHGDEWPALVYKCFDDDSLRRIFALRTAILQYDTAPERRDFLKLALTAILRIVTFAGVSE